jgi:hypothetical protein
LRWVRVQAPILDLTTTVDAHRELASVDALQGDLHILHFVRMVINYCQIDDGEKIRNGFIANVMRVIGKIPRTAHVQTSSIAHGSPPAARAVFLQAAAELIDLLTHHQLIHSLLLSSVA